MSFYGALLKSKLVSKSRKNQTLEKTNISYMIPGIKRKNTTWRNNLNSFKHDSISILRQIESLKFCLYSILKQNLLKYSVYPSAHDTLHLMPFTTYWPPSEAPQIQPFPFGGSDNVLTSHLLSVLRISAANTVPIQIFWKSFIWF